MGSASTDFVIPLSVIGVLVAIGIPALMRGQLVVGALCLAGAVGIAAATFLRLWRSRD
jgi:hypothetical protein